MSIEHDRGQNNHVDLSLDDEKYTSAHQFLNDVLYLVEGEVRVEPFEHVAVQLDPARTRFFSDGVVCFGGEYNEYSYNEFMSGNWPAYRAKITAVLGGNLVKMTYITNERREQK